MKAAGAFFVGVLLHLCGTHMAVTASSLEDKLVPTDCGGCLGGIQGLIGHRVKEMACRAKMVMSLFSLLERPEDLKSRGQATT
jgi:hypothetical protein